jgi:hypothetical protein
VRLQKEAASFIEAKYPAATITSAWPFPMRCAARNSAM